MSRKRSNKKNLLYLDESLRKRESGHYRAVYYISVIQAGTGKVFPNRESVVSVHYKGTLINGREFDNSWKTGVPRKPFSLERSD